MFWEITEKQWPPKVQKCIFLVTLMPPLNIHPTIYDLLIFMFNDGVALWRVNFRAEKWMLKTGNLDETVNPIWQ